MNKNYLIIGLIILALVVIGVIAARQPEAPLVETDPNDIVEVEEVASLTVSDQVVADNSIIIDNIYAEEAGWVVLHRTTEEGDLNPEAVAGIVGVPAGASQDVVVALTETVENGEVLVAMLHVDTDELGEYEFTAETPELDAPVQVGGDIVVSFFTVSTEVEETEEEVDAEAEVDADAELDATE